MNVEQRKNGWGGGSGGGGGVEGEIYYHTQLSLECLEHMNSHMRMWRMLELGPAVDERGVQLGRRKRGGKGADGVLGGWRRRRTWI